MGMGALASPLPEGFASPAAPRAPPDRSGLDPLREPPAAAAGLRGPGPGDHGAVPPRVEIGGRRQVVLVNPRSGGGRGRWLLDRLRGAGVEAVDLSTRTPEALVAERHGREDEALVVAGGDGTVASVLEAAHGEAVRRGGAPLAVGVLPLGTGNDLARHLGWSGGDWTGRWSEALERLDAGSDRWLDRWLLRGPFLRRPWFNYCSWGLDARIAWRFHHLRLVQPGLFRSRLGNQMVYAGLGLIDPGGPLPLRLEGRRLPSWARALVLSNIPSYAGGGCLGRGIRPDDAAVDAFVLGGGVLLGLGARGLRRPLRLGRQGGLVLRVFRRVPLQLDGEPMLAPPGRYVVEHGGRVRLVAPAGA